MIEFKKTANRDSIHSIDVTDIKFTINSNDIPLTDLIEEFKYFLLACGYYIDGDIVIQDDDDTDQEEE